MKSLSSWGFSISWRLTEDVQCSLSHFVPPTWCISISQRGISNVSSLVLFIEMSLFKIFIRHQSFGYHNANFGHWLGGNLTRPMFFTTFTQHRLLCYGKTCREVGFKSHIERPVGFELATFRIEWCAFSTLFFQ